MTVILGFRFRHHHPQSFDILSQVDRVELVWADNPATDPNFHGYRIYRAEDLQNAEYQLIFECSVDDSIVNSYSDRDCELGHGYYYYVSSCSLDPGEGIIESGRALHTDDHGSRSGIKFYRRSDRCKLFS